MNISQISSAIGTALAQGGDAANPVKVLVGGVEKHIVKVTLVRGDVVVAPQEAPEADRLVIELEG